MNPNELIRFIELVNDIKPSYLSFNEAVIDLHWSEDIKANKAGLKKLEAHWKIVLADRMAQSGELQLHPVID